MKKTSKIFLETVWLAASIVLLGLWASSVLMARNGSGLESWWQLPWPSKFQPVELEAKRFFYNRFPPQIRNHAYAHIDPVALRHTLREGANWVLSVQDPSGRFKYWYDPVLDQYNPSSEDSFHRQAGAAYSLALAYRMTGDGRYLEGARQNVRYLLRYKRDLAPDKSYFLFDEMADLGSASIPMFTMLEIRELTATTEYDELLHRLAGFILFLQEKYGTGQFKSTYYYKGDYELEKRRGWESDIFPGEAMLALAGMYKSFREAAYKDGLDRALQFYSAPKYWKHHAFLPWTIMAFASLYAQTGERKYADYVVLLSDYLLIEQNLDERDEVYGSFHAFPSINTASYLEGLGEAIQLVDSLGDTRRERLYEERAMIGLRWILKLQYRADETNEGKSSNKSLGGFHGSMTDAVIRIDYNAHAISALSRALRYLFRQSAELTDTIQ